MKRILTTTALTMMLAGPAFADAHMSKYVTGAEELEVLGSEFIGSRVYVVEKDLDDDYEYSADAETEWDDIGEINEIVMTREGDLQAVVIGVGGLMGIGEKDVAVQMDKLRFVQNGDGPSDYFLVFTSSVEELEAAPEWEDQERQMAAAKVREQREKLRADVEENGANATPPAAIMSDMDKLDSVKREGYALVEAGSFKADDLIGARVYGVGDEDVGEIADLVLAKSGGDQDAIVDVGGLLGIGEKPVAIPMGELRIMKEADGDDLRVYIDATQERLEKLPEYKM